MDHILTDIVLFRQVEELPDLADPLGSQTAGVGCVGQSRDLLVSLLHYYQIQYTEMWIKLASNDFPARDYQSIIIQKSGVTRDWLHVPEKVT